MSILHVCTSCGIVAHDSREEQKGGDDIDMIDSKQVHFNPPYNDQKVDADIAFDGFMNQAER